MKRNSRKRKNSVKQKKKTVIKSSKYKEHHLGAYEGTNLALNLAIFGMPLPIKW